MTDFGITGASSLGADINKAEHLESPEAQQGISADKKPILSLNMKNEDIVKLTTQWERDWNNSPKKTEWEEKYKDNENYWLGKQFDKLAADKTRPLTDNVIFEAVETYLPQTTRRNPEPIVLLDKREGEAPQSEEFKEQVKDRLVDIADIKKLRLKIKKVARHWTIYLLGVGKVSWDDEYRIPTINIIRPTKIILDPDATIDEDGYTGGYVGEHKELKAQQVIDKIKELEGGNEEAVKKIKDQVKEDLATKIKFIEWTTPKYVCWTLKELVLFKSKNPHWNYEQTQKESSVDTYGNETENEVEVEGINHFPTQKMPYVFLSVFNLGDQPMDKTSLIGQNLSTQDLINTRNKQITENVDDMNGGMVVSLERSGLSQGEAKQVTRALRKGGVVAIPAGSPREAVDRFSAQGLPADVYNDLADKRLRLRDVFGVSGSSAAGLQNERTVRGKIMNRGTDTDRIGGGVSEYLEQFADDVYNWFVQLLYVYDPDFQFAPGVIPPKLVVSVQEGSLLPKDNVSIANQALELASAGKISTIDLFKRLEYPNPEELAANVWLEANAPHLLFGENQLVQQAIQEQQQAAQAQAQAEQQAQQSQIETEMQAKQTDAELEVEKEAAKQQLQFRGNTAEEITGEFAQEAI